MVATEFVIRRGYHPDDFRATLAELERAGKVRWRDFETLELIG